MALSAHFSGLAKHESATVPRRQQWCRSRHVDACADFCIASPNNAQKVGAFLLLVSTYRGGLPSLVHLFSRRLSSVMLSRKHLLAKVSAKDPLTHCPIGYVDHYHP